MVRHTWRRVLDLSPETLFLIFATFGGLVLVALIPPVAGGNEQFNFQRVANIAAFHLLIEPAQVPLGTKRLLDMAHRQFNPGQLPPYHYSSAQFDAIASIPLDARTPATLDPNPIAVLNPVAYIPQVGAYWLGEAFGWSPLVLFYLGRLAGLAAAIGLTFAAIRRMPFHRYGLCAVALLPTLAFSRSTLDADQVTNGLAFLFVASILRVASGGQPIRWRNVLWLAALAFLIAQCKSAYLVLLALAFAIPVDLYGSARRYLLASLAIAVPGALVSVAWMLSLQHGYFAGIHYFVRGAAIYPDGQVAAILADPLNYAQIVARTIFLSPLAPLSLIGLIGLFGPPVFMPALAYPLVAGALAAVLIGEGANIAWRPSALLCILAIASALAGFGLILTLLYVQWDSLGAPVIQGFSGRYLYPFAPLLLLFVPTKKLALFGLDAKAWTAILGVIAACFTLGVTWSTYWA